MNPVVYVRLMYPELLDIEENATQHDVTIMHEDHKDAVRIFRDSVDA